MNIFVDLGDLGSRARRWSWALVLAAVSATTVTGCGGGESKGPRGAPVLLKAFWRTGTDRAVIWSRTTDANLKASVPPAGLEFDLTFQGRLDGNKIEDTVRVDGGLTTRPKEMPPVTVTWPGIETLPPGTFKLAVGYNSLPLAGGGSGTSYVFGRGTPTYPSATTLTIHLDTAALTSVYNEVMEGPATIEVRTEPFLAKLVPPMVCPGGQPRPVATDFQLPLAFNNLPVADQDRVITFMHIATADTPLPFRLVADPRNAATLLVLPGATAGVDARWPAGARVDVTVDAGLPDLFGVGLSASVSGSFITLAPGDDGANRCPPVVDGGAVDALDGGIGDSRDGGPADAVDDAVEVGDDATDAADDATDAVNDAIDAADDAPAG